MDDHDDHPWYTVSWPWHRKRRMVELHISKPATIIHESPMFHFPCSCLSHFITIFTIQHQHHGYSPPSRPREFGISPSHQAWSQSAGRAVRTATASTLKIREKRQVLSTGTRFLLCLPGTPSARVVGCSHFERWSQQQTININRDPHWVYWNIGFTMW